MRILIVQPLFLRGGAEKQIAALASRFQRKGHDVTLLTCQAIQSEWADNLRSDGTEILETGSDFAEASEWVSMGYVGKLRTVGTLAAFMKKNRALVSEFDVVNLHNWPSYIAAWEAGLSQEGQPPIVWTCNEPTEFWFSRNPLLRYHLHLLERRCIRGIHATVVLSTFMREFMLTRYGTQSTIIAPGVSPPDKSDGISRERPHPGHGLNVICYTRMAYFPIQVLEHLVRQQSEPILHLFGSRAALAYRYAVRRGLQARVQVHRWMPDREMERFMTSMDVMIFPHLTPFGLTAIESLAAGVPVVSIAAGGQLDIVKDGYNGYAIPVAEPADFASAIVSNLASIKSEEMRIRCARDAIERFSWEQAATRYLQLFEQVQTKG